VKPALYLDVDGVVLPLGRGNGDCDRLRVGPFVVDVSRLVQVRPYTYNWSKKSQVPVGTFQQWAKFVTNSQAAPGTCGKPRGGG
jgi:hypothetical protein